jgi:hypothetical protein
MRLPIQTFLFKNKSHAMNFLREKNVASDTNLHNLNKLKFVLLLLKTKNRSQK